MIVELLKHLRVDIERAARKPCSEVELPVASMLNDVCRFLKLSPAETKKVLGVRAYTAINGNDPVNGGVRKVSPVAGTRNPAAAHTRAGKHGLKRGTIVYKSKQS